MKPQAVSTQWNELKLMQNDYLIQESFSLFCNWKPLHFSSLEHQFISVSDGTRHESRLLIDVDSTIGKFFVNPMIRPLFIGYEMAQARLKHNVEEVGNFEFFLPALYEKNI